MPAIKKHITPPEVKIRLSGVNGAVWKLAEVPLAVYISQYFNIYPPKAD